MQFSYMRLVSFRKSQSFEASAALLSVIAALLT